MAALAVAMMIAMAATSTRSDRDIASLLFMEGLNFFRLSVSLGLFRLVYFAFAFTLPLHGNSSRIRYFDYAASISLVLKKFRMVPAPAWLLPNPVTNRQINFLFGEMQRICMAENASVSRHFLLLKHSFVYFLSAACAAAKRATGTRNGEQET
ncbi:MAG: hypothetical protein JO256_14435 [Alphaproteobacteria bacterium]|nr:hypothetical protein [Alphaproteobacteria bacterium]